MYELLYLRPPKVRAVHGALNTFRVLVLCPIPHHRNFDLDSDRCGNRKRDGDTYNHLLLRNAHPVSRGSYTSAA